VGAHARPAADAPELVFLDHEDVVETDNLLISILKPHGLLLVVAIDEIEGLFQMLIILGTALAFCAAPLELPVLALIGLALLQHLVQLVQIGR
jgi:hypothetical protein